MNIFDIRVGNILSMESNTTFDLALTVGRTDLLEYMEIYWLLADGHIEHHIYAYAEKYGSVNFY